MSGRQTLCPDEVSESCICIFIFDVHQNKSRTLAKLGSSNAILNLKKRKKENENEKTTLERWNLIVVIISNIHYVNARPSLEY